MLDNLQNEPALDPDRDRNPGDGLGSAAISLGMFALAVVTAICWLVF